MQTTNGKTCLTHTFRIHFWLKCPHWGSVRTLREAVDEEAGQEHEKDAVAGRMGETSAEVSSSHGEFASSSLIRLFSFFCPVLLMFCDDVCQGCRGSLW